VHLPGSCTVLDQYFSAIGTHPYLGYTPRLIRPEFFNEKGQPAPPANISGVDPEVAAILGKRRLRHPAAL
jgi:hypothetical protein